MKTKFFLLACFTAIGAGTFGQNFAFDIIKDEPIEPRISVNLDYFNLDLNTEISAIRLDNMSMNIGLFGYVKTLPFLDIDYNVHKSWLVFGKLGFKDYKGNTEVNTGVNFWLTKRVVRKDTKVVLNVEEDRGIDEVTRTTTYVMTPANHLKRFGLRGGIYGKSGPFNFDDYADGQNFSEVEETKISSYGIYGGLTFRRIINIIIKDDAYGQSFNSAGRDLYIDGLFVPINRFKDLNAEGALVTDEVKSFRSQMPFGFRLGYRIFQVEKKTFTGKKFGMCGIGEAGYKPYQGWFISAGFGLTLVKI